MAKKRREADFVQRVKEGYDRLSATNRKIAEYVTARFYEVLFPSAAELSNALGTSEAMAALESDSDGVDFFPGIPGTLRALTAEGIRLGVVSNTVLPLHDKREFFEQGGFGDVWDSIVLSVDVGAQKPDPAIYLRAAEQLGIPPADCAFLGHEPYEISGAREAGMRTISFNGDSPIGAERHVECFSELFSVIVDSRSVSHHAVTTLPGNNP